MPGESGYEKLTLDLAQKWGADVIRDSDGTTLSPEIIDAGYGIYSTVCIIRDHNEWAKKNTDKLQSVILMSFPKIAEEDELTIDLLDGYFEEQFRVNDSADALEYYQVFDRTANTEVTDWTYSDGKVTVKNAKKMHKYTVNFFAWRIWEEISMYNHVTNNWDKEHLMQIDPIYPEVQEYMLAWMKNWCENHPATTVVRFTSMFYNFVWIFGKNMRTLYGDWGSYDFTVSPRALNLFREQYGYTLTSEDFINKGKLHVTHMPATEKQRDWMNFINRFVIDFGKKLVDIAHSYGKKAYVFYDDSWVGVEPWADTFKEFGFDGLIKCVFNGFEARMCAGVEGVTHEIRLHPYLFPTGLGGLPTFAPGGNPTRDAKQYWCAVRRALLREKIDRIGLGGYLSLTLPFPEFNDYIETLADEFRSIGALHEKGKPNVLNKRVAVLTYWGKLRSWTCSGHFYDQAQIDLMNVNETLSGMPLHVEYIDFDDVKNGKLKDFDVVINAGRGGSAWSGGEIWQDIDVADRISEFVFSGGRFIGINEPSFCSGFDYNFRLEHILGVESDRGDRFCHTKYEGVKKESGLVEENTAIAPNENVFITRPDVEVLLENGNKAVITSRDFGKGKGIYMSSFRIGSENNRTLLNLILGENAKNEKFVSSNPACDCAYFKGENKLIIVNNTMEKQTTTVRTNGQDTVVTLDAAESVII